MNTPKTIHLNRFFPLKWLLLWLILTAIPSVLESLDPNRAITQYHMENWRMERGLPHNSVFSITQTQDGYLWIGTMNGLARYDGVKFTVYDRNNTPQLNSNFIRALYADRRGNLWIGSRDGGLTLKTPEGTFKTWSTRQYPFLSGITALQQDRSGRLWISTATNGLAYLENDQLQRYADSTGLQNVRVNGFLECPSGYLWLAAREGLFRKKNSGPFSRFNGIGDTADNAAHAICANKNGGFWVGTQGAIFSIRGDAVKIHRPKKELENSIPISLLEDSNGALWIGYDGGGLARLDNNRFEYFSETDGLPNNYIFSIFEDQEKNIWIGSSNGGIVRFIETSFLNFSRREGLASEDVRSLLEDPEGNILISTFKGVFRYDPKQRRMDLVFSTQNGLADDSIQNLMADKEGNLWISSSNGLHQVSRHRSGIRKFSIRDGLSCTFIKTLFQDPSGNIWVGARQSLHRFANGKFTNYSKKVNLKNATIFCLEADDNGNLWIGTDHGLYILENETVRRADDDLNLANAIIYTIHKKPGGVFYVGTRDNGLYCYYNGRFKNLTTQAGLVENWISIILEDNSGGIWLAGRYAVSRIAETELLKYLNNETSVLRPKVYNEQDGLKSRKFHNRGLTSKDGKLWFCSDAGIEVIDPNLLVPSRRHPNIFVEDVLIDGERFRSDHHSVVTPPGKKRLEFHYTAISFINPQKIKFRVRLVPYDNEWLDMGANRSATYTGLPPGSYAFEVTACNSDGIWSNKISSLSVVVEPYFYQTRWFLVSSIFLIIASVVAGVRMKIRRLIAREKLLSTMVDERTRDLRERSRQLEITHKKLQKSKEIIEEKSLNIMASIEYARRIQQAMLPRDDAIKSITDNFFIIFKPKDILSGDFYWYGRKGENFFIAVVDCTGHGVPGALLTVAGKLLADEITIQKENTTPAEILTKLDVAVRGALNQEGGESPSDDGMDAVVCMINPHLGQIVFSGAKRPLYIYKDAELTVIKGARKTIGGYRKSPNTHFENISVPFLTEISIYLTSDGFIDQHNPDNKKMGGRYFRELLQSVSGLAMKEQKNKIWAAFDSFRKDEEQRDDITLIGLHIKKGSS